MSGSFPKFQKFIGVVILGYLTAGPWLARAQPANGGAPPRDIRIAELQGTVDVTAAGAARWTAARTNQTLHPFERLRTGANSRVALIWSDQSVVAFGASTELEILPPSSQTAQCGLHLVKGIISFFHRDKPGNIQIITHGAIAGVEGTEFILSVDEAERTTLSVVDGKVKFGNDQATLVLTNGEQAVVDLGQAPVRTPGFIANNLLQWCFYYPAVLDLDDLPLTDNERTALQPSLDAYRAGDLLTALANYSSATNRDSNAGKIYYAALLLAVGQVGDSEQVMLSLPAGDEHSARLVGALRRLSAAVKHQPDDTTFEPRFATELLAASYYEQSRAVNEVSLDNALRFARRATENSPRLGFAWERVAELELSFGRTADALAALEKGLALSPRNAQALALKGFLLMAENRPGDAITWFNQAITVDAALGNAWLGRGLCRIRLGDAEGGREDLLVAAALEPQRAELRSYLGKAFANAGDFPHATRELQLAKKLDPHDPTAWLYSALLNQEKNQVNDAIRDLEKSEALNDNRSVYRSALLLDQDRAVRGANLAAMYRDAGMSDVSSREAARAVNYDYANYSAHLFLANSYNELLDPNEVALRYETAMKNEYLLANLLSPAAAGALSPTVSQQQYAQLFERNYPGVASDTEYFSRGAWNESGAQFGTFDNFSYNLEAHYHVDPGTRPNDDFEQRTLSLAFKQQFTPRDSVYAQALDYDAAGGDLHQYYDPATASPSFRFKETQRPTAVLGYHHEWDPGVHTLALVARVDDRYSFTNSTQPTIVTSKPDATPGNPQLAGVQGITMHEGFQNEVTLYSAEAQQIWQTSVHNTILGVRGQYGEFETTNVQNFPSALASTFPTPPTNSAEQDIDTRFYRASIYAYHQWQIVEPLQLIGGVSYDWMRFPANAQMAPVSGAEQTASQISPKAGFIWTPHQSTTVRFAYTRSLGDANVGQSYQLEPSQVAGFAQSFRSIIPESVTAETAGAGFENYGLSLEQKFSTGTYLGVYGTVLRSHVRRVDGVFDVLPDELDFAIPSTLHEELNFYEKTLQLNANQLISRDWSLGGQYRVSDATLRNNFTDVPDGLSFTGFTPRQRTEAVLQQLNLFLVYNHPSGFFARTEALWNGQWNSGYTPALANDDFWQFNAFAGWRLLHRHADVTLGVLNIGDQDYRLNPLNLYAELPRSRTFIVRVRVNF